MKKHATLASMAQTLGLSRSTVSEILSGNQRYAEETVQRVHELAALLHYQPNRSAQTTRRGRSNLIGVLHSSGTLQVVNERALYLGRAIAETGYELLVGDWLWHTSGTLISLVRHMIASRVEGMIFSDAATFSHQDTAAILKLVNEANLPAVIISAPHQGGIPAINADFESGFYDLTRHLLETGRKRLTLMLGSPVEESWHTILRYNGFCRAIREAGGTVHPPLQADDYCRRWQGEGVQGEVLYRSFLSPAIGAPYVEIGQCFSSLLDQGFETDGIVASNDQWAAALVNTCIRKGVRIPEAFAITGFDNSYLSVLSAIPITSASQSSELSCQLAVQTLMKQMANPQSPVDDVLVPCPLIIRDSSAIISR